MFKILTALFVGSVMSQEKKPNAWPNKFQQSFTEKQIYGFLHGETKGEFYYNFDTK